MTKVTIDKHRIGQIVELVKAGEPLEPSGTGWTLTDCLMIAGVLLSTAMSATSLVHGKQPAGRGGTQKLLQDLQGGIEFVGAMTNAHGNGTWDDYFEPIVTIGLGAEAVTPISGFKK
jgi:hypothetical protein